MHRKSAFLSMTVFGSKVVFVPPHGAQRMWLSNMWEEMRSRSDFVSLLLLAIILCPCLSYLLWSCLVTVSQS